MGSASGGGVPAWGSRCFRFFFLRALLQTDGTFFPGPNRRRNLSTCVGGEVIKHLNILVTKEILSLGYDWWFTFPGLNSGKSSVTLGNALAASFCMIPARGRLSISGAPRVPKPWQGRSVSDSESEELLKSTLSTVEDGAMMEGRIMPSPSSPTVIKGGDRSEQQHRQLHQSWLQQVII